MHKKNSDSFCGGQKAAQQKYGTESAALALINNPMAPSVDRLWPGFSEFIEECPYFFMATSNSDGRPNCNFRGGGRGFVFVEDDRTLYFADYQGNGLLHCVGDFFENPQIGMLFINFNRRQRIKLSGNVEIIDDHDELEQFRSRKLFKNAVRVIKVNVEYAVLNCPRFLDTFFEEEM